MPQAALRVLGPSASKPNRLPRALGRNYARNFVDVPVLTASASTRIFAWLIGFPWDGAHMRVYHACAQPNVPSNSTQSGFLCGRASAK